MIEMLEIFLKNKLYNQHMIAKHLVSFSTAIDYFVRSLCPSDMTVARNAYYFDISASNTTRWYDNYENNAHSDLIQTVLVQTWFA